MYAAGNSRAQRWKPPTDGLCSLGLRSTKQKSMVEVERRPVDVGDATLPLLGLIAPLPKVRFGPNMRNTESRGGPRGRSTNLSEEKETTTNALDRVKSSCNACTTFLEFGIGTGDVFALSLPFAGDSGQLLLSMTGTVWITTRIWNRRNQAWVPY